MTVNVEERLKALEAKTSMLRLVCAMQFAILCALCISWMQSRRVEAASSPVLHAQGLVIEDSQGRARILLGAPLPKATERIRQDATTTSMVFLDEQGHDRLTLGEEPEPQINGKVLSTVHRIAQGFGVVIHDGKGDERGAYGWLSNGRALITLDRPGLDAWAAIVDDKTGFAGMRVEYAPQIASDKTGIEIGTKGPQAFFKLKDTTEKDRAILSLEADGHTHFNTLDSAGKVIQDRKWPQP